MSIESDPSEEEMIARLQQAGFDTENFLSAIEVQGASLDELPEATHTALPMTSLAVAAAMRGCFLPSDLTNDVDGQKSSVAEIIAESDVLSTGAERVWQLRPQARRDILQTAARTNLQTLLRENSTVLRAHDREGPLLRRVLAGQPLDPDLMDLEELEHLATIAQWLEGTDLAQLPDPLDLRRLIARREILDPFRLLVGRPLAAGSDNQQDRVVGRRAQTEQLRAYVGIRDPEELKHYVTRALGTLWSSATFRGANQPLLVRGIGGMGKSTLIGKFVLDHVLFPGVDLPFVYLDFDRAALAPRQPLQLLIEIAVQLGLCLPLAEEELSKYRSNLRLTIDSQAANYTRREREQATGSELSGYCETLRSIVERFNNGRAPVLIVFDTYEIVQYDDEAVAGVSALISALRMPAMGEWSNLRIVVAGRGDLADIETSLKPVDLGQLSLTETKELLRRRSATEVLDLTEVHIGKLARALRNSPLDVIVATNWLKGQAPDERVSLLMSLIEGIGQEIDASVQGAGQCEAELVTLRITGILTRRMIEHINDKDVRQLAEPGLVVRTITPQIIRDVMAPVSGLSDDDHPLPEGTEQELFQRLEREHWLVTRQGSVLRHRPEVRRAMLALMRVKDEKKFDAANERALEKFREQAMQDETARSETIYHMLLRARPPLEDIDALWTSAMARPLSSAVDDLAEPAQGYLKAKLGRSVPVATLAAFSVPILGSLLRDQGPRLLRSLGVDAFLNLLNANPDLNASADSRGLRMEAIYRSGRWSHLRDAAAGNIARSGEIVSAIEMLTQARLDDVMHLPSAMLRSLRFILRWATRDTKADLLLIRAIERFTSVADSSEIAMDIPEIAWDFATLMVCGEGRGFAVDRWPILNRASDFARSALKLPDGAAGSDALRILSFFEMAPDRPLLKRIDFENHFATLSHREVGAFLDVFTEQSGNQLPNGASSKAPNAYAEMLARGERLAQMLGKYHGDFVIADAEITREFAAVVRGCLNLGPPHIADQVLRMLAFKHPDWLEPLGNALTRAFDGQVPTRMGWWSSVEKYVGTGERARKLKDNPDGRAVLSLADEATSLQGAVMAYAKLLASRKSSAQVRDFIALSQAFEDWVGMIHRQIQERQW
ncbi:ATP-binding protein [Pseudomonas putida]|uniref:ATP-binding protein n=1 Tax=Pseudomonas putida TaxID=303 RepID=UPI0006454C1C|nr:ATP-binding protein [Pseudomonas putida]